MPYRPEIDGLRAVAVLAVIFFHAGIGAVPGGYFGVDVFFVISGFLLTTIIIDESARSEFRFLHFYERRARRILPALLTVVAICVPFAWVILTPDQMADFCQSIFAVNFFVSNMLFWHESGYFALAADQKPLLHTWSLAVEEQFYFLLPIILTLSIKYLKKHDFLCILFLAVLSLVTAEWGWRNAPSANFYMLPTRAWELLLGSLCAFRAFNAKPLTGNLLSLAGLALIAFGFHAFDESTPDPSLYTLVPVVGAALVIVYANTGTFVGRLLSLRPFVYLGGISYSLYLWHQPIFAFYRTQVSFRSDLAIVLLFAILLASAHFSWKYVERPFRQRDLIPRKSFALGVIACTLALCGFAVAGQMSNGFEGRLSASERSILAYVNYPRAHMFREGSCFLAPEQGPANFADICVQSSRDQRMIWGDSHAAALSYGMRSFTPPTSQLTASGCPPLMDTYFPMRPECRAINRHVLEIVGRQQPDRLILHAQWVTYEGQVAALDRTLTMIANIAPNTEITIIGGVPQWEPSLPELFLRAGGSLATSGLYIRNFELDRVKRLDALLGVIARKHGVHIRYPVEILCRDVRCMASVSASGSKVSLTTWDHSHLTAEGSLYVANRLFANSAPRSR